MGTLHKAYGFRVVGWCPCNFSSVTEKMVDPVWLVTQSTPFSLVFPIRTEFAQKSSNALTQPQPSPAWPCPGCGREATIEEVCRSLDNTRWLMLWRCVVAESPEVRYELTSREANPCTLHSCGVPRTRIFCEVR